MDYFFMYIICGVIFTVIFTIKARESGNLKRVTVSDAFHLFGVVFVWLPLLFVFLWVKIRDFVLFGGKND